MQVRPETLADISAIRGVNETAFGRSAEADLVDVLRDDNDVALSLVAIEDDQIIGHILFCPIRIDGASKVLSAVSLSPMAVLPEYQKRGVGSKLVEDGLEVLRDNGTEVVTVLGHPKFYSRFDFKPAQNFSIECPYDVPPEAWMLIELAPGVLSGQSGKVVYPRAFASL